MGGGDLKKRTAVEWKNKKKRNIRAPIRRNRDRIIIGTRGCGYSEGDV